MALTCSHLAQEALALPRAERYELAILLAHSVAPDEEPSDAEWSEILRQADEDLQSGKDPGSTFEEVFGEKL
jgi:hypothetical protein